MDLSWKLNDHVQDNRNIRPDGEDCLHLTEITDGFLPLYTINCYTLIRVEKKKTFLLADLKHVAQSGRSVQWKAAGPS